VDKRLITESGKVTLLDKLATKLINDGHKILIFSQFTKMLDLLEDWVGQLKGWRYCRIDGSTPQVDRQEAMDAFNSDSRYKVFLLSTRSGGLGINLTAADTVILFDSDWNPQQDLQAMDRVHRIGQTKPVIVYRLATACTIEESLLERASSKRWLGHLVIERGRFKGFASKGLNPDAEIERLHQELEQHKLRRRKMHGGGISNNDMKVILDRSPEAYERARNRTEDLSDNIAIASI
jgi:ATP-dependent DNA helicase